MKTHITENLGWLLPLFAIALLLAFAPQLHAQATATAPVADSTITAPTGPAPTVGVAESIMTYLTPIIALLVTGLANKVIPKIPNWLVPIIASGIGLATTSITAYVTGHPTNIWLGLLAGAAATTLHQVGTQLTTPVKPA